MPMLWKTEEVPNVYLSALCAWREARGESDEAIRGVLHVIRTRALKPSWWGIGYDGVILKPYQFSSFNVGDPNSMKFPFLSDQKFRRILELTEKVLVGQDEDLTDGATHYHDSSIPTPAEWKNMKPTATIGRLLFFKES